MNLKSSFVTWALKIGMSKAGPFIAAGASWLGVHIVTWLHLPNFLPGDAVLKIQNAITHGSAEIGLALAAIAYSMIVHGQSNRTVILKAQLAGSEPRTPDLNLNNGAIGEATLKAAEIVTGVPVEDAADVAGVTIKRAEPAA